jgi:hypothetical protein
VCIVSAEKIAEDYKNRGTRRGAATPPLSAIPVEPYWSMFITPPPTKQQPAPGEVKKDFVGMSSLKLGAFCVWIPGPWVDCICGGCGRIMTVRSLHDHWDKSHHCKYNIVGLKNIVAYHNNYLMDPESGGRPGPDVVDFGDQLDNNTEEIDSVTIVESTSAQMTSWKQIVYSEYKNHEAISKELFDFLVQNEDVAEDAEEVIQADPVTDGRLSQWTVIKLRGLMSEILSKKQHKEKAPNSPKKSPASPKKRPASPAKSPSPAKKTKVAKEGKSEGDDNPFLNYIFDRYDKATLSATPKKVLTIIMDEHFKRLSSKQVKEAHAALDELCKK